MGYMVPVPDVIDVIARLNIRFAEGDAILEMVGLQREFKIFATKHDLRASFALLGMVPASTGSRGRWMRYLDHLGKLSSDIKRTSGHDRIRDTLRDDLEGDHLPVSFTTHDVKKTPYVTVSTGLANPFSATTYRIISVPARPARVAAGGPAKKAARKR